jgi:hypothetical protein
MIIVMIVPLTSIARMPPEALISLLSFPLPPHNALASNDP